MPSSKQQDTFWEKLKEKRDTFIYGLGPLLWAYVAFTEAQAYSSSYTFAIHLTVMSCAYSVLALCAQIVTRQKEYSEKKMSVADREAAEENHVDFIVSKMMTLQDIKADPRYIIIGCV